MSKPKRPKTKQQKLKEWKRQQRKIPAWVRDEERRQREHLRSI